MLGTSALSTRMEFSVTTARTRRAYKQDVQHFMRTLPGARSFGD
jgi:hypothetical protein